MNYHKNNTSSKAIKNYLPHIGAERASQEIIEGLKAEQKYISSKFFYDKEGSELFERITNLKEYYPTRLEKEILSAMGNKLDIDFSDLSVVELGSGDHSKIRLLLDQIPKDKLPTIKYIPVDISQSAIESAIKNLTHEFSNLKVEAIVADFMHQLDMIPKSKKRLFCFFGSTIGNLTTKEIEEFMNLIGSEMKEGDMLLLGMDMVKETSVLERAYNDESLITEKFNKNILNVANRLADTNFNCDDFDHIAFFNEEKNRIEMHLKAKKDGVIATKFGSIKFKKNETIHTENSYKFKREHIDLIGEWAGLNIERVFSDKNGWFSLVHYKKQG